MAFRVSLVNLQKLTLSMCVAAREHRDVRAGREHALLRRGEHHRAHLRMLEAQPLDGVGELDIDAEIVGVEFQRIVAGDGAALVDIERERGDGPVDAEPPVAVVVRVGAEVDHRAHALSRSASLLVAPETIGRVPSRHP